MQYFKSRSAAGEMLADQIEARYHHTNCAVIALSDGSVMVAAQIALRLRAVLTMLITAPIVLPRENNALASVDQEGGMTYNGMFSDSEVKEMEGEYRNYIDQERQQNLLKMTSQEGSVISKKLLRNRSVILVSDGLSSAFPLDAAASYIKPVKIDKLIIATPLASVPVIDRMHLLADEIYCLDALSDYISTDHYYETNDVPNHEATVKLVQKVIELWR